MRWRSLALLGLLPALLATLLLAVAALVLFRDPLVNSQPVRDELIAQLRKFTGRDVSLAGDIEIDDFPWITVVVGPGSFANPIGFTGPPLFTWQQIRLRMHFSSLYAATPRFDRITLNGLVAELRRDAAGRDNWSDIGPIEPLGPPETLLAIPLIELRNASLRYTDERIAAAPLATVEQLDAELRDLTRGTGEVEGLHWHATTAELRGVAKAMALGGPVSLRVRDLDLRLLTGAPSLTARTLQLEHGALRAALEALVLRPPDVSARLRLEPVALDALLRLAGIEPPFASDPQRLQVRSLAARLQFESGLLRFDDLEARVDETQIRGSVAFTDPIRVDLRADALLADRYAAAFGGPDDRDPQAPLAFPAAMLRDLPLAGRIRVGRLRTGAATLSGVTLRLEARPRGASGPRKGASTPR